MSALTRRGVASGLAALTLPVAAVAAPANPDAELIRLCNAYVAAIGAYNCGGGYLECEDDPLWHAVVAIEEPLDELQPHTLAGVAAMARVAHFLAQQPSGEDFSDSFIGDWGERIIRGVLALAAA